MPIVDTSAFRRAVLYVVMRSGEVRMTRLHKVLYLTDLEHYLEYGHTLTAAPWVREKYGPMTKAMLPSLKDMAGHEVDQVDRQTATGRTSKVIRRGSQPRFEHNMSQAEIDTIERILSMTRGLTDDQVKALAYATTPMQLIQDQERAQGRVLIDTPIDFRTMTKPELLAPARSEPDFAARAEAQRRDMEVMAPFVARALGASGE